MAMVQMNKVKPFEDSTRLINNPAALREQAETNGYLYFRGLLDPEAVLGLRRQILEVCRQDGLLDELKPLMDGIVRDGAFIRENEASEEFRNFYRKIVRLRDFYALAQSTPVIQMLEKVFGESVLTHGRNICRVVFPSSSRFTTAPHQDFPYIGGSDRTWTCWIPLGDVPPELGGLAVIPKSHRKGILAVKPAEGANDLQVEIPEDIEWAYSPMKSGDALFLNCMTVHQGRDNTIPNKLRISVDYRYQPASEPVRSDSLEPHYGGFGQGWEDIYAGWPAGNDPLKYYWKNLKLDVVEVPRGENFKDRRVTVDNQKAASLS